MNNQPIDVIIFSPPYAETDPTGTKFEYRRDGKNDRGQSLKNGNYQPSENGIGNLCYGCTLQASAEYKPDKEHIVVFRSTAGFKGFKRYFTKDSVTHPAKANLFMLKWIIRNFTTEGEIVCDPMAGTGSTGIIAALLNRNAILVEYESKFVKMIQNNIALFERRKTLTPRGKIVAFQGDARQLSHVLCKHQTEIDTIITSPPYQRGMTPIQDKDFILKVNLGRGRKRQDVKKWSHPESLDKNNIGNLPHGEISAIITSPPYEASVKSEEGPGAKVWDKEKGHWVQHPDFLTKYSNDKHNLGNLSGQTYLEAMFLVYRECWKVLKPDGYLIIIVKNFIRKKKIVRLDLDTIKLCQRAGFRLQERWYRKLTEQSFWRILYHRKFPKVPKIEYEDVLVFRKVNK